MPTDVSLTALTDFAGRVLSALGAPMANATRVADSLVSSDAHGHSSHGVRRLVPYADQVRSGVLDPAAVPTVVAGTPDAVVRVDGAGAFGQLTAARGAEELVARVSRTAVGCAVLERCHHVGRLGEYVGTLAEAGLVGIAFANADPTVAPWGGRDRVLGTNPTAWGLPVRAGRPPVLVDFATAATAEGKLSVSRDRGEQVPTGLLVDREGHDSAEPQDFYDGGALLPFGAHKGYGLSVAFDLVAGVLSRTGSASAPGYDGTFGTVLMAVDVTAFVDLDDFTAEVEALRERLHASRPRPGVDGVLMPGEPEWAVREERRRTGVPLSPRTRGDLDDLADSLGTDRLPD
jgi:LDH2 family malate/lactate/ureidoglycolate dehydrogenase